MHTAADSTIVPAASGRFLHDHVADFVRSLIEDGTLKPGDRVPSLRAIRRRLEVSMATATRAYETLEEGGWIEARPQSGFYVRSPRAAALEAPQRGHTPGRPERLDVPSLLGSLAPADESDNAVTLSLALPDPELLPTRALQRALTRVARAHPGASTEYAFPPGIETLRRQIAYRVAGAGCRVHPDDVLVTSGCAEALTIALQCVARPGDVIAVESPTFFNILTMIERLGMRALELPTDPLEGLDPQAFERALEHNSVSAALLVPNFNNPLGSCMPDAAKRRVVELAQRYALPVIEDDIYGDLHFGDRRPSLLRAFDDGSHVLTASSFSKTVAPGYRVGWLLAGRWREGANSLKHALSMATATLPQLVMADFLENGAYERHLRRLRSAYHAQVERMRHAIAQHFPAGTRVSEPRGGFLLWVQLPDRVQAIDVYRAALDAGVRVAPGNLFGSGAAYDQYLRLSCGAPWQPALETAIAALGRIVHDLAQWPAHGDIGA